MSVSDIMPERSAYEFEESLGALLSECAKTAEAKATEKAEAAKKEPVNGIHAVANSRTPLEEVREIIAARPKTAEEALVEHGVRSDLRKAAARVQQSVDTLARVATNRSK